MSRIIEQMPEGDSWMPPSFTPKAAWRKKKILEYLEILNFWSPFFLKTNQSYESLSCGNPITFVPGRKCLIRLGSSAFQKIANKQFILHTLSLSGTISSRSFILAGEGKKILTLFRKNKVTKQ